MLMQTRGFMMHPLIAAPLAAVSRVSLPSPLLLAADTDVSIAMARAVSRTVEIPIHDKDEVVRSSWRSCCPLQRHWRS